MGMSSGKEIERFQQFSKILKKDGKAEGVIEIKNGNHFVTVDETDFRIDGKGLWLRPSVKNLNLGEQLNNTIREGIPTPVFFPLVYGVLVGSTGFILVAAAIFTALVLFNFFTNKPAIASDSPNFKMITSLNEDERFIISHPEFVKEVVTAYENFAHLNLDSKLKTNDFDGPQHPASLIRILAKDMRRVITVAEQVGGPSKIDAFSALKSLISNPPVNEKHLHKMRAGLKTMSANLSSILTSRHDQQHNGFADVMEEANNRIAAEAKLEREIVETMNPETDSN